MAKLSKRELQAARLAGVSRQRATKGDVEITRDGPITRARVQDPIDRYFSRGTIDGPQHQAAQQFWGDYMQSGLDPWSKGSGGGHAGGTAKTPGCGPRYLHYRRAAQSLGPVLHSAVYAIVLCGVSAEDWAINRAKPSKDGIAALRLALDTLSIHYGFCTASRILAPHAEEQIDPARERLPAFC